MSDASFSNNQPPDATDKPARPLQPNEGPATSENDNRGASPQAIFRQSVSSLIVVTAIAALGFWGHHTGWKVPRFSQLSGDRKARLDDWCEQHAVPASQCVECEPDKFPKLPDYGWCDAHGVHQCPLDNPDVAQLKVPLPPSDSRLERIERALAIRSTTANNKACTNYNRRIQFVSHECVVNAGVEVQPVKTGAIGDVITANGEIRYDSTRVSSLSSRAAGTVWQVCKEIGDSVRQGEVLALIDAAEVGKLKAELLAALADEDLQADRLRRLQRIDVPAAQVRETETELKKAKTRALSAHQALLNLELSVSLNALRESSIEDDHLASHIRLLGLPDPVVSKLDPGLITSNLMAITSRLDGIVIARDATEGQVVDTTRVLFTVADTSRMWLVLNVPIEDTGLVEIGQTVQFTPEGGGDDIRGIVAWISTAVDPITRTVEVRANVENTAGQLRDSTFGTGHIVLRQESEAVLVPNTAVHWEGSCFVVFVRDKNYAETSAPKLFHTRSVRPGVRGPQVTEIIAGLLPNEYVATNGSGVLRAQLLKSSIGAG